MEGSFIFGESVGHRGSRRQHEPEMDGHGAFPVQLGADVHHRVGRLPHLQERTGNTITIKLQQTCVVNLNKLNLSEPVKAFLLDKLSYRFPGEQRENAQSLFGQVAVGLHAAPVGELKREKIPAVLRADGLRQQQGQTVVS